MSMISIIHQIIWRILILAEYVVLFVVTISLNHIVASDFQISPEEILKRAQTQIQKDKNKTNQAYTGTFLGRKITRVANKDILLKQYNEEEKKLKESIIQLHEENSKNGVTYDLNSVLKEKLESFHEGKNEALKEERTFIHRIFSDGKKKRLETFWLNDSRPLSEIKKDLLTSPESCFGVFQVEITDGTYSSLSSLWDSSFGSQAKASLFLNENEAEKTRELIDLGVVSKDGFYDVPFFNFGRDILPSAEIRRLSRDSLLKISGRKEIQDEGEVYIIQAGEPNKNMAYLEQRILPEKGYVVSYSGMTMNEKIVREDIFKNYHKIEQDIWVPSYSKARVRIKEGDGDECFNSTEYLVIEPLRLHKSLPNELFLMTLTDLEKHVIDTQGYYQVGTQIRFPEIQSYHELHKNSWTVNRILFWLGINLVWIALIIMLIRSKRGKLSK